MALLPFREMKVCQVNIKCNHRNFAYPLHVLIHIVRNTFFLQSAFLQSYEAKKKQYRLTLHFLQQKLATFLPLIVSKY